ncbi:hypothetical protein EW145_g3986 [Phellinidium pouzarii]|uniref:DUF7598 domain-containing protein n=1 Tax=Phellinidium pouzarii TaxID=167371 RepID=A0A4V3XCQ8_9AGAM|nr:hypothetical protein EW145_g3986 [Phellinidium pouzarii]
MLPPRAYIFIGLNGIRILSIIALLLVFSSSILVMVDDVRAYNKFISNTQSGSNNSDNSNSTMVDCDYIEGSTVPNQPGGIFWAVLNRLLIIFQVVILILSEIGWPYTFFDKYFPVLGSNFGLGALGLIQCFIGAAVLSHHVDDFALVSAFFLFALGCLNILAGLIFREKAKDKRSVTSWQSEKRKGLLPMVQEKAGERPGPFRPLFTGQPPPSFTQGSRFTDEKSSVLSGEKGYGWGRAAERFAAGKGGLLITRPLEALPPYGPGARLPPSVSPHHSGDVEKQEPNFQSSGKAL